MIDLADILSLGQVANAATSRTIMTYSALWGVSTAGIAWYVLTVARQVTYITLADGRRELRSLPLIFRVLLPLTPNIIPLFRLSAFERMRKRVRRDLVSAGFEDLINADELLSMRFLMPLLLGPVWIYFIYATVSAIPGKFGAALVDNQILFDLIGLLLTSLYPAIWLKSTLKQRHLAIQRAMPFVLDLLTLSVEAGMDFMTALQRTSEHGKMTALNEELLRVIRQIQLGKTRRDSLRDMIERVNHSDVTTLLNAIVQADELGVSLGAILRIQSDQIRNKRFERAEKLANEAPIKLLFPLLFFIFPSVFLILLGPVIMELLRRGF